MALLNRERLVFILCAILIVGGGVFGGGPIDPQTSAMVELVACGLFGMAVVGLVNGDCPKQAYPALGLAALIWALPLIQLIPLPAGLWRSLPGHAVPDAISQLAGQGANARPLSLSPEDTRMHALALIVPIAMFLGVVQLDTPARDKLIRVIVAFAFVSAILGVFQVAVGGDLYFYSFTHVGFPVGFFANRNHEADLLLIALPMSVRMASSMHLRREVRRMLMIGLVAFFAAAVVQTQSRSALAILPGVLLGTYVTYVGRLGGRQFWAITAVLAMIALLAYALLHFTPLGNHMLQRFSEADQDLRPQFWKATILAIREYWPTGSGIGSFVPVYKMGEDLNYITTDWVNHAHNDYLETVMEGGLAAVLLFLLYAAMLAWRTIARVPEWLGAQKWAAFTGIMVLMLHSLTDYPLRTFGLLAIFGFLNGTLYPSGRALKVRRERSHPVDPQPIFVKPFNEMPEPAAS